MKQYLELLENIVENGVDKPAARKGMPGSVSLFGPQIEMDLKDGFPLLTTKKMPWKMIVTELIWFLRGDTNIKYLVDNGCNIWNEDAFNYYCKIADNLSDRKQIPILALKSGRDVSFQQYSYSQFCSLINQHTKESFIKNFSYGNYTLGDCGFQYGKVWRDWETSKDIIVDTGKFYTSGEKRVEFKKKTIDQITNLINGLRGNPQSRRHIVTAIDPAHDQDLALYWCHALFQFNARSISLEERVSVAIHNEVVDCEWRRGNQEEMCDRYNIPKYYLDCKLYQRSADVILGVPFNIASYALLTEIIAKIVNMIPGKFIHSFGDVHIYENHTLAYLEQKSREPYSLPRLVFDKSFDNHIVQWDIGDVWSTSEMISSLEPEWFQIEDYQHHPRIKAKLSTGLK